MKKEKISKRDEVLIDMFCKEIDDAVLFERMMSKYERNIFDEGEVDEIKEDIKIDDEAKKYNL